MEAIVSTGAKLTLTKDKQRAYREQIKEVEIREQRIYLLYWVSALVIEISNVNSELPYVRNNAEIYTRMFLFPSSASLALVYRKQRIPPLAYLRPSGGVLTVQAVIWTNVLAGGPETIQACHGLPLHGSLSPWWWDILPGTKLSPSHFQEWFIAPIPVP